MCLVRLCLHVFSKAVFTCRLVRLYLHVFSKAVFT